jgi:mRNA-degrading endonuclease toxin of MazEF toxin-antitoxin module
MYTDPPNKGVRPVVIVSPDFRNQHERAQTVLAIPLTTSIHKEVPTHVVLTSAETGLPADSAARVEDITVVSKKDLVPPRSGLRRISHTRICQLGDLIQIAIGCSGRF